MKKMIMFVGIMLLTSCAQIVTIKKAPNLAVNKGNIQVELKNGKTKDIMDANLKDVTGKVKVGTKYKLKGKSLKEIK